LLIVLRVPVHNAQRLASVAQLDAAKPFDAAMPFGAAATAKMHAPSKIQAQHARCMLRLARRRAQ
jgi:hypothetical protein